MTKKLTLKTLAIVARFNQTNGDDKIIPTYTSAEMTSGRTFLLGMYTAQGIMMKWNLCEGLHQRPASIKTVERWMRKGPDTKNVNFETWFLELAKTEGWIPPVAKDLTLSEQLKVLEDRIDTIHEDANAATVMGITGFANELRRRNVPVVYSTIQADIIRSMFHRYNVG